MGLSIRGDLRVACSSASPERPPGEVTISLQTSGPTIVKQMDFRVRMPLERVTLSPDSCHEDEVR